MSRSLIPNSTQIPDVILDHWMAELSGAEFKVLLYIARRTYGFGKESDSISLSQIAQGLKRRDGRVLDRGTGLSRASVVRALSVLEGEGVIIRKNNVSEKTREFEENTYSINLAWELPAGGKGGGTPLGEPEGGDGEGESTRRGALKGVVVNRRAKTSHRWALQNQPGLKVVDSLPHRPGTPSGHVGSTAPLREQREASRGSRGRQ